MNLPISINLPQGFLDAEVRCGYEVSSEMKKVWAIQLDILSNFKSVCEKLDLKWFIDAGSLLGAVRHGGFIPWDDDIDVCMFRDDYEKLCLAGSEAFRYPYFLQTYKTDPMSLRCHAQIRRSDTTAILNSEMINGLPLYRFNQGIFIDVFPIDSLPDNPDKAMPYLHRIESMKWLLTYGREVVALKKVCGFKRFLFLRYWISLVGYLKRVRHVNQILLNEHRLARCAEEHDRYVQKFNRYKPKYVGAISFWPIRECSQYYQRRYFKDTVYVNFETLSVPAPGGFIELLEGLYGDWKVPVRGGSLHSNIFFDCSKAYKEYFI